MSMQLNRHNVIDYLVAHDICSADQVQQDQISPQVAKNFNLKVPLKTGQYLLVKQEACGQDGQAIGEFLNEWSVRQLIQAFPDLAALNDYLPQVLHFDRVASILVLDYLDEYQDVSRFYLKEENFLPAIAEAYGSTLGTIHRLTFQQGRYRQYLSYRQTFSAIAELCQDLQLLAAPPPEILGQVSEADLKFLGLYQRYDSLALSIATLLNSRRPCCLTHNDLKLNNLLLANNWTPATLPQDIRFIDWERAEWGDPAWDLGALIASYLCLWLSSLVVGSSLSIEESLALATISLEQLQPSIGGVLDGYLEQFPQILDHCPDFLNQTMRFAGLNLIQSLRGDVQHAKTFSNTGLLFLQVAKRLLTQPQDSLGLVLGNPGQQVQRTAA